MSIVAPAPSNWKVGPRSPEVERALGEALGVPPLLASLLARRGLTDPEAASQFLNPTLDDLHDPKLLPDYRAAADAILGARDRGDIVYVHGDYDVDGVTSTALLSRFLTKIGCKVEMHVPHRIREGYGIHLSAVQAAADLGARVFLTCDCGSSAHEQIEFAKQRGMQVVVTDHHTVSEKPTGADAFINVHRSDSRYPFQHLSGVGVAFKLCQGLTEELGHTKEGYCRAYLDLAALGTIADVMPLIGENRIIAKFGLERLSETNKVGLQALMRESKLERGSVLDANAVGFRLGPRINAAGRIDDSAIALRLLMTTDDVEAAMIANRLEQVNIERKRAQQAMIDEAVQMVVDSGAHLRNVIVVGHESWHPGIVGIVAGRLVEQFHRPAFVLNLNSETGVGKGSARSIPNFHLAQALVASGDLILSGGGHAEAAGLSILSKDIEQFRDSLDQYAGTVLTEEDLRVSLDVDFGIEPDELTEAAVRSLDRMKPYGVDNAAPRLMIQNVEILRLNPTKNPVHTTLSLRTPKGMTVKGAGFGLGERLAANAVGDRLDAVVEPCINAWQGRESLEWHIKDYALSASD